MLFHKYSNLNALALLSTVRRVQVQKTRSVKLRPSFTLNNNGHRLGHVSGLPPARSPPVAPLPAPAAAAAAAAATEGAEAGGDYTIDAAKRMKYEELFPVETRKFGYDPSNAARTSRDRTVEQALDDRVRKKADRYCK